MKTVKATVGCIIEKEGKILMTLRNIEPFKNRWCIPGGHIDFGEEPRDAVIREVKEETGLDISPKFLFYCNEYFSVMNWHAVGLIFYAKGEGAIKKCDREVKEIGWFSKEQALKLELAFEHRKILDNYFKGSAIN